MVALVGAGSALAQPPNRVKVLIGFNSQPGRAEQALVRGVGGRIKYTYHLVPAIAATVPEAAIDGLRRNPNVTHVELDGRVYAIDAELDAAWGVKHIGAGIVHDAGNRGTGIKVAVIDSGIDYTHPDLAANYADGWDFVNGDNDPDNSDHDGPMDDYGHGTHVAGTVAALDNEVGVVGVAPEAKLYAVKVLDETGRGYVSDIIAGIQWAAGNNMQVINMSLGGGYSETEEVACQAAYDAGVLVVAAAGNSGNPPGRGDKVIYPAAYDTVIAVAATDQSDERATWSSTGPAVELAAPGVSVFSTWNDSDSPYDPQPTYDIDADGWYKEASGTSMASPHVAGTAALVLAANPGWSNEQVRTQLQTTADDLGAKGWDAWYGFGLVDAYEAAAPSGPGNEPPTVSISSPADGSTFDSGDTIVFEGTASDEDGDLTAGLVWTSSIDEQIGTGGSFSATLSDGSHTITASVTDSGDKTGSASITVQVGTPSEPTTASVDSISYATDGGRDSNKHLSVTIALVDDAGNPVSSASVSIDVYLGESLYASATGTTGTGGIVTFKLPNALSGWYTTDVTDVAAEGLIWDRVIPENGFTKQ